MNHISAKQIRKLLGRAIRTRRERLKLTQEKLARKAFLHRTYLSDVELGARNPSVESIRRIARALQTPISRLFKIAEASHLAKRNSSHRL